MSPFRLLPAVLAVVTACGDNIEPPQSVAPGVVFAFPVDGQLDVPTGVRIVVTFSDEVTERALGACDAGGAGGFCLVGPGGPAAVAPAVVGDRKSIEIPSGQLEPGTTYELHVGRELAPFAKNLPETGPLVRFTTRSVRTRSAPPSVIAVNGTPPARLGEPGARPMFETSTIQLVFSEPLAPGTVLSAPGSVELRAGGAEGPVVPATVIAEGVHVAIDPREDLTPGTTYQLRLGGGITDLGKQPLAPIAFDLVPLDTRGPGGPYAQVLRTRQPGDPGPKSSRTGAEPNVIQLDKPLIGHETVTMKESALAAELGDPTALGGPIAFTIRRGQRMRASGLDVKLGGEIPAGLATGDLQIELLTDAGGRLYRNPLHPPEQRPDNASSPLYVDLSLDLAVFATDRTGTAVLSQTILGVQASGIATPTGGVLAIETVAAMDLGLLGVTSGSSNFVLELITSTGDAIPIDTQAPALIVTYPAEGTAELPVDNGIELVFDEPVDLDRLRAGGLRLEDSAGTELAAAIESHGAAVVLRPLAPLAYAKSYRVLISDVADVAGNRLASSMTLQFSTLPLVSPNTPPPPPPPDGPLYAPMTVIAISPGPPCALIGGIGANPGRCSGGAMTDDLYRPFTIKADRPIEVEFSQPLDRTSVALGTACGTGSVRVEELPAAGGCVPVPGTLLVRDRGFAFVPDKPWAAGARYRLVLVSGDDATCNAGELCSTNRVPASFDPLAGTEQANAGGPDLVADFLGAAPSSATTVLVHASPWTDLNGSGFVDIGEVLRDENRAALHIAGTTGFVRGASFIAEDCLPGTPGVQACMYLFGAIPVTMEELTTNCPIPGGGSASSCVPVAIAPQAMYATSVRMMVALGPTITITTDTETVVMRIREPASGYIVDGGGAPKMVVALNLYMDAPDLDVFVAAHDLHSKQLSVVLEGPVKFLPDGRIAIEASNTADVPADVGMKAVDTMGNVLTGSITMLVPKGEMKLRLVSPPIRGGAR